MNLQEYIRQSFMRPNKQVLKSLGASDDLIAYLMETPSNTNMAIVSQFISSEESSEPVEEPNGGSNSGSEPGSSSESGSGSNSGEGGNESGGENGGGSETPAPTSYTIRLKEYPNQLEVDYPTYVVPAGESISINSQDGYVEGEWGLPMYWYDADDPEQIGLSLYDLSNYTPVKDTLLILRWFDPNKNIWYDDYYAEPVSDNNGNGNDNSGDLSPTFDDPDNP